MSDEGEGRLAGPAYGPWFWIALVAGWAVIGGAVVGLVVDAADTHPANLLLYFAGGALVQDLLLAPTVLGVGWLVTRRLPVSVRPVVAGALIVIGAVSLYAFPFVRGYGRDPANPSLLPNDYGAALAAVVAAVGVVALMAVGIARRPWTRSVRQPRSGR